MRKIPVVLTVAAMALCLLLNGCGGKNGETETQPHHELISEENTAETEAAAEENTAENDAGEFAAADGETEAETETEAAETDLSYQTGTTVRTPYFTVTLPSSWAGRYVAVLEDPAPGTDNLCSLRFFEKRNYDADGGGHLYTFVIKPASEEGDPSGMFPEWKRIVIDGVEYSLATYYATDFQCVAVSDDDTLDNYNEMHEGFGERQPVLEAVSPAYFK